MTLREELPAFDTPDLAEQWAEALAVLTHVGELEVPCAMSVGARRVLFQVVRAMGARRVLDIGTYLGTSALAFALAVGEDGVVVSVDNQPHHWREQGARSPDHLMRDAGMSGRVEFVTQDARGYLRQTEDRFDLISIDGWHEDFAVEDEVGLALGHLLPGGLIFLDDVQVEGEELPIGLDRIDGPRIALERMVQDGAPFRVVPVRQTLEGGWCAAAFLVAHA